MLRPVMLSAFLLLVTQASFSQNYRILHWGIEDGLSQGINQKIIRDSEGFLWITSYEGLNRFDGKTFRNFYSSTKKRNSIRGIETTGLVEDSLYKIWIGSGEGLNRYDPVTDSVIVFASDPGKTNRIQYIIPAAATSDEVICFTISGQIVGYNSKTFARRVIAENINWYDDYVNLNNSWLDKKNNLLWMPASNGFASVNLNSGKTNYYLDKVQVNAILPIDERGSLMLGTDNGLVEWNIPTGDTILTISLDKNFLGKVTSLAKSKEQHLLVGTEEHGLFIINPDKSVTHLVKSSAEQSSISGNKINSILCDNTGIVWLGVATNGIDQLIPGNRFTHYAENKNSRNSLSNNIVRGFLEDNNKNIWIATQGGGINIFNPQQRSFSTLTRKNLPGLPFDFIRYLIKENGETALVGTEKGMCRINMPTLKTTRIGFVTAANDPLPDPYIEQIIPYEKNSCLIATKEFGLFTLPNLSNTAKQLPNPGNKHVFYSAFMNQYLFLSIWDDDPKIFKVENGEWKEVRKDLTSYLITYVLYDGKNKRYWIGTLKGLLETDDNLNILRQYTTDDGLSNHYIYAMVLDRAGLLWISTNKGISQFNTQTRMLKVFTPADGLQGYEYNAKAGFLASDNSLYFGGTNGFDLIRTGSATQGNASSKFYIKDLLVNNVSYASDRNINYTAAIYLPYSGNNITIQSGVIDYNTGGNNKIKYMVEEIDPDWKIADRDFNINYSGLPPGNYTFKATAANTDNIWNENYTTLNFSIAKPWWQSWWLRGGLILGIAVFILLLIRSYYHRKLEKQKMEFEKQQAVEHERTRIATDMHDDLGAGLSTIRFLSEKVKRNSFSNITRDDINKMQLTSNELLEKMNEIIWAMNERNDSLEDLLFYTRYYAQEYCEENNLNCTISLPENIPAIFVSGEMRRNIFLTVKESLHNIVKHAQAKTVDITVRINNALEIIIKDDGKGLGTVNKYVGGNGLKNMQKRMESVGGVLNIENGQGVSVSVKVPLT